MTENVKHIAETLTGAGFQALIAGGAVRNSFLNIPAKDFDFVTDATPDQVEALFPKTIPLGKSFGVIVVVMEDGEQFEVATFRVDSKTGDGRRPDSVEFTSDASVDASRRDFTVNAMFQNPLTGEVLDFFGGKQDIQDKMIRFVGNPNDRIEEDKLRMLRAIRFASTLGFHIHRRTMRAIDENSHKIVEVSAERIREEISKMLLGSFPRTAMQMLFQTGLMKHILPEVDDLFGLEQPEHWHPEGDVLVHTFGVVEQLRRFNEFPTVPLMWAGLLHDVGKKTRMKFNPEKGHNQFIGHAEDSANMTVEIMQRLKFSNKEIEEVRFAVANHMKMHDFAKMKISKQRLLAENEHFMTLVHLSMADTRSTFRFEEAEALLAQAEKVLALPKIEKLINGDDLVALGFEGVRIGRALKSLKLAQFEGNVKTREQALRFCNGVA